MNDRLNTCYKIHIRDLTMAFILRSYLGQKTCKNSKFLKNLQNRKCQR
jgi:hypothetical protein